MENKEATIRMSKNLIPRTWTAMLFKKKKNYDYSINHEYGPMADGLWLIDLISHSNIYCIKKIGGVLVSHSESTSQKINIIDKKQITGFNLFKKNFDKNNCFSSIEKDIIFKNLEPKVDEIVFKQFFSCIIKDDQDGLKKLLNFLRECQFSKLSRKYLLIITIFKYLFFLKALLRLVNYFRKFIITILSKHKTRKYKTFLKDVL